MFSCVLTFAGYDTALNASFSKKLLEDEIGGFVLKDIKEALLIVSQADFPIKALCGDDLVLAVIIGTEGPAYRSPGTAMVVVDTGERIGNLSSGCVEGDVGIHSQEALRTGRARQLRYGRGSPSCSPVAAVWIS